jgi:hypothetical protein
MRTLPYQFPLLDLASELGFTSAQCKAHPLGAALAKDFDDLLATTQKAILKEIDLVVALAAAEAKVARADDALNQLLDQINLVLLGLVGKNREAPLYQRFFGGQRPSDAKRPILGAQLEMMRDWIPTLQAATQPELKGLAAPVEAGVKAADMAVVALRKAEQELADFTEIGDCKDLIDKANAARKAAYGKLAEAVHKNPSLNLPSDFAEQFFARESHFSAPGQKELQARIARAEQQLAKLKQQLAAEDERRAQVEKQRREAEAAALRAEFTAAEETMEEARRRAAAIKSKLEALGHEQPSA